ncbi:MAG: hypothetical protein ACYC61_18465, partial [Isosphaeraceae bacterium]
MTNWLRWAGGLLVVAVLSLVSYGCNSEEPSPTGPSGSTGGPGQASKSGSAAEPQNAQAQKAPTEL